MEVSHPLTNAIKSVKSFCNARLKCKRSQRDWTRKNQKQPSRLSDFQQKGEQGEQTAHKVSLLQIQVMKFQGYRDNLKETAKIIGIGMRKIIGWAQRM